MECLKIIILVFIMVMVTSPVANGQKMSLPATDAKTSQIWKAIAPYFSPPKKFKGKYGDYRTPLKFYDGDTVRTKQAWKKRRKEIRTQWMDMMGEWPPILKKQKLKIINTTHREGVTQHRIRFNWTPNEETKGYLLVPDGKGKKPAVITVFYEPETAIEEKGNVNFAYQLAKRGFVTLSLGTTQTTKAKTYSLYYPSIKNAQIEPLSTLAYAAANAWYVLSKVPQVDSTRIGIMGHSYGGKWAMFASSLFDKFAAGVWSDPGIVFDESKSMANYWAPWYLGYTPPPWSEDGWDKHYRKGLYPKLRDENYNLQDLHALMAPRPFLVSGGITDTPVRWVPLNHTIAVNHLLGYKNRIAMTNRKKHSPNKHSNQVAYLFFEYFLKRNGLSAKN